MSNVNKARLHHAAVQCDPAQSVPPSTHFLVENMNVMSPSSANGCYASTSSCSSELSVMSVRPPVPGQEKSHCREESRSPPACLRWARALHCLLEDPDGVQLFRKYLQAEGRSHADALDFWFACEGLRKQPDKAGQLVKLIYKRFFVKSALPISDELRRDVARRVKETPMSSLHHSSKLEHVFDVAQSEVERLINTTTYPNFLRSDMYVQYVQTVQCGGGIAGAASSTASSSSSSSDVALGQSSAALLPTLHEDHEFVTGSEQPMRLTKDMLLVTQKRRLDVRPKPEAYAGMYSHHVYRLNGPYHHSHGSAVSSHPHACYSSYNPVSRQDSELQSLSSHSDARTESDNMSLTDSSIDGVSSIYHRVTSRKQRKLAALNCEPHLHQTLIPRTQRLDNKHCLPMKPDQFAAILIDKLEKLRREQEAQEKLDRKLMEGDCALADAIRDKFRLDDDNDQDILDQHVSRVWSDRTPCRSPSPGRRARTRRKERDVFSTFSSDSGNVHDFADNAMVKSRSMPEPARRAKKTLTELTDSGVSVVSDTPPAGTVKESRVLSWLLEADRNSKYRSHRTTRSSSLERGREPAQPFIADPNMPPLPPPHTATQLEEARRRLMLEDEVRTPRRPNTLRKSATSSSNCYTTAIISFCDEQFPYRTKIPGKQVTLRQFKDYLPKKGSFRYFFKTQCEELEHQVIQEEVCCDGDLLPMWEGKIMAQVKPID